MTRLTMLIAGTGIAVMCAQGFSKQTPNHLGEFRKMKRNQSGFTLIEIAIVLVIIGLLLGGVLKGQELINSAKVKNLAADFKNVPLYIYGYQDRFRALPGDDANSLIHVSGVPAATPVAANVGNGLIEGNWDSLTATDESVVFWQQVRLAGFAAGPPGRHDLPLRSQHGEGEAVRSGDRQAPMSV